MNKQTFYILEASISEDIDEIMMDYYHRTRNVYHNDELVIIAPHGDVGHLDGFDKLETVEFYAVPATEYSFLYQTFQSKPNWKDNGAFAEKSETAKKGFGAPSTLHVIHDADLAQKLLDFEPTQEMIDYYNEINAE